MPDTSVRSTPYPLAGLIDDQAGSVPLAAAVTAIGPTAVCLFWPGSLESGWLQPSTVSDQPVSRVAADTLGMVVVTVRPSLSVVTYSPPLVSRTARFPAA